MFHAGLFLDSGIAIQYAIEKKGVLLL